MTNEEIQTGILIDRYITGILTERESSELLRILAASQGSRRALCDNLRVHWFLNEKYAPLRLRMKEESQEVALSDFGDIDALLEWEKTVTPRVSERESKPSSPPPPPQGPKNAPESSIVERKKKSHEEHQRKRWANGRLIMCIVFGFALIGLAEWYEIHRQHKENTFTQLAQIEETIDAVWSSEKESYKRGQRMDETRLTLESGMFRLRFNSGAEIVLKGPGDFLITGADRAVCNRGEVSAHIPPDAVGFEIKTPAGNIIDRGTDFYLNVAPDKVEVEVVKGIVDVATQGKSQRLLDQSGLTFDGSTIWESFVPLGNRYITREVFDSKVDDYTKWLRERREASNAKLDTRPDLLARFDFEQASPPTLSDRSPRGQRNGNSLELIRCREDEGPLFRSTSIRFGGRDSFARLNIPGTFSSVTLSVNLRIDQLANRGNVILTGADYYSKPGTILWQISKTGEPMFYIAQKEGTIPSAFPAPAVLSRRMWGTWSRFTVVADATNRSVSHYLDGRLVATIPWNNPIPIDLGTCFLGNFLNQKMTANDRYLSAAIGDLIVFDKALTPQEIADLDSYAKPNSQ